MGNYMTVRWQSLKRGAVAVTCVGAVSLGIVGPAFAEGHFHSYISGWTDGHTSRAWKDLNQDGTNTRATFSTGCNREFTSTIRKENFGPDTNMGSEHINCFSYVDAVTAGDVPADDYHFDVTGLGAVCYSGKCYPNELNVPGVDVYW
jgi:hypothetical protein